MTDTFEALLECSVDVEASAQRVWDVVSDVRRMPEFSPDVVSTRLRAGFDRVGLGAEFTNLNRMSGLDWTTHGEIVRFDPGVEIAFKIAENWVIWSFRLDALSSGATRLTQRRETPEGISPFSLGLTDSHLGGQQTFTQALRDGMRKTLEHMKAVAESSS